MAPSDFDSPASTTQGRSGDQSLRDRRGSSRDGDQDCRASTPTGPAGGPRTVRFKRGQTIFAAGQGQGMVFIVRSGCVRLYKNLPDGRSINLGLLGPTSIFTQEDSVEGMSKGATAEALLETVVAAIELDALAGIIARTPQLAAAIIKGLTRRSTELQTLVEQLLARDTSVRLATTLLALAGHFGRPDEDGMVAITLPLTHRALAGMIGSNRVTVTRGLLDLQRTGHIRSFGRNALAVDSAKLRRYASAAGNVGHA